MIYCDDRGNVLDRSASLFIEQKVYVNTDNDYTLKRWQITTQ